MFAKYHFPDAITCLPTSIPIAFPLINQKGRKTLASETGTGNKKHIKDHCNDVKFREKNWEEKFLKRGLLLFTNIIKNTC